MENARDTFYVTLRNRLSALNPNRRMLLRGVERPGILVDENESMASKPPADIFVLRWTGVKVDTQHALPWMQQVCEISYMTAGSESTGGLDRGRALMAMDGELRAMLQPTRTLKMNYAVTPAVAMETQVFWIDPVFGAATKADDELSRTVDVTVYSYEEAGEQ
ncbi:MAG: hypothetical protein ACR2JE_06635 [Acidobacteriaceae bacterium]